jgi:hypothetical protein
MKRKREEEERTARTWIKERAIGGMDWTHLA